MKDYLIRIHGRDKNNPRRLVGVVVEVGVKGNRAFSNLDEFWEILNPLKKKPGRSGRNGKKRNKKNGPNL